MVGSGHVDSQIGRRRRSGRFGFQADAVDFNDGVGVFVSGFGRGVHVRHPRHRLARRVVKGLGLKQRACSILALRRLRHCGEFRAIAQNDELADAAFEVRVGAPGDSMPCSALSVTWTSKGVGGGVVSLTSPVLV